MNRKPDKVEDPAASYGTKKVPEQVAACPASKQVDEATFKKVADKIFKERKDLLHKLAQ